MVHILYETEYGRTVATYLFCSEEHRSIYTAEHRGKPRSEEVKNDRANLERNQTETGDCCCDHCGKPLRDLWLTD